MRNRGWRESRSVCARGISAWLLVAAVGGSLPAAAAPVTPLAWQGEITGATGARVTGKLVDWNRDVDHNFIDDVLDELIATDPEKTVDIIVDFNRCVTCTKGSEEEIILLLQKLGTLDHVSQVVTFAVVTDVRARDVQLLADRPEVAMVEYMEPAVATLENSVAAIRVRTSGTFFPNTVQDAFPTITGNGVNIAVIDSGVDDVGGPGVTHSMFPAGTFVGGGNCLSNPCVAGNPDDDQRHGTHVAGAALGRLVACGTTTCRGVAPGARLVDIKVLNSANSCVGASCVRGIEYAIQNRAAWNIKVINLSIGNCQASNGLNATAQLINTAVSLGMVVVVAAGNTTNCGLPNNAALINDWASASLAITVGAVNDGNTVPLNNDTLAIFSLRGPRLSDNDVDPRDEQKPEITAPGDQINSAQFNTNNGFINLSGTSMAAPHVAGAAALLLQQNPAMNPGSLKEVLIQTAVQSNKPGPHPGWDIGWGFGFLNMHAALARTTATDVGRPTEPPYAPCGAAWCSPHISTAAQPRVNQANTISAQVRNHTATAASNVRVCFGVYVFSNQGDRFHELGCRTVNIPGNTTQTVNLPWTPSAALIPTGFPANQPVHACLKVSIDYANDTVFTNNDMQRNTSIAQASIARVPFRLENNLTEPKTVTVRIENNSKWAVRIYENGVLVTDPTFVLQPSDCPRDLVIEIEPPADAALGDTAEIIVRAVTEDGEDFGGIVIEGIHEEHEVTAAQAPPSAHPDPIESGHGAFLSGAWRFFAHPPLL
ncbi:MAG TPA: S8 family serine peptidase [Thermoanaerobaculia bacterium]|nr:S8 family serine peptidase [Thermoanaerobaculia bacterium]